MSTGEEYKESNGGAIPTPNWQNDELDKADRILLIRNM
jgi:hypothetical protein